MLVKSDTDIETTFNRLSRNFAVHTFQSDGMTLSLVFKKKLSRVEEFEVYSAKCKSKYTNAAGLVKLWESIKSAAFKPKM